MAKFRVGQMVRIVRFDVSDAIHCRGAFLPGTIENGEFEILEVRENLPKHYNSIVVNLKGISSCGKRIIDIYNWIFPECCLEDARVDPFRKRVIRIKTKRQRSL